MNSRMGYGLKRVETIQSINEMNRKVHYRVNANEVEVCESKKSLVKIQVRLERHN